ncbi:hypothetical protein J6590_020503 [Homalodisca vitripennis]|nr:hypothetical protein J6590_020503 [Homalodisca vitripennis]
MLEAEDLVVSRSEWLEKRSVWARNALSQDDEEQLGSVTTSTACVDYVSLRIADRELTSSIIWMSSNELAVIFTDQQMSVQKKLRKPDPGTLSGPRSPASESTPQTSPVSAAAQQPRLWIQPSDTREPLFVVPLQGLRTGSSISALTTATGCHPLRAEPLPSIMLWSVATASYVTASYEASDQPPQGNLALFAVLFLVCCVEVVIVKVVSDEMEPPDHDQPII